MKVTQANFATIANGVVTVMKQEEELRGLVGRVYSLLARGFWGRLKWLLTGK